MFPSFASARCALTIALLSGPLAFAQSPPPTLESAQSAPPMDALSVNQAMRLAEQRSQALRAQALMADAAQARAVAAGQRPDPVFRVGLDNVPIEGAADHRLTREAMTARSVGISQTLPSASKRLARSQAFEQQADLARVRGEAQRIELRRATALAWWAVRAETQRLAVLTAQKNEADRIVLASEASFRASTGQQSDVFLARGARLKLDEQTLIRQASLDNARTTLRRWVGAPGDRPLLSADTAVLQRHPLGDGPAQAWAERDPEVQAALAREAAAAAMVGLAREDVAADWTVDLRFSQLGPRFDNKLTLGFSVPIRWDTANRQEREVVARLAETAQAQADTEETRRARLADIERWQQGWQLGLQRLDLLDNQGLPLAQTGVAAALAAYRAANGGLAMVLQARQAELAVQLERVQLELDAASDWARLDALNSPQEVTP
jgi:cobalt-zinc-cadmium efflux system outer membrane protein